MSDCNSDPGFPLHRSADLVGCSVVGECSGTGPFGPAKATVSVQSESMGIGGGGGEVPFIVDIFLHMVDELKYEPDMRT